jgi:hypothetical protein
VKLPSLPEVPLPGPFFEITVSSRLQVAALRVVLWLLPASAVDFALANRDGGGHPAWIALAASFAALAFAVLVVGARCDSGEDAP